MALFTGVLGIYLSIIANNRKERCSLRPNRRESVCARDVDNRCPNTPACRLTRDRLSSRLNVSRKRCRVPCSDQSSTNIKRASFAFCAMPTFLTIQQVLDLALILLTKQQAFAASSKAVFTATPRLLRPCPFAGDCANHGRVYKPETCRFMYI